MSARIITLTNLNSTPNFIEIDENCVKKICAEVLLSCTPVTLNQGKVQLD